MKYLLLKPYFDDKIWAGKFINKIFNIEEENKGEALLISALPKKSSVVLNDLKKRNLEEFYKSNKNLFGNYPSDQYPLLTKILDAGDNLSVQVHPDDELAKSLKLKNGKTEAWYVLQKMDDDKLIYGLKEDDFSNLKNDLGSPKIENHLNYVKVQNGDFLYIPAGQVHALTKGSLVWEVQQNSDTTFRLYDYQRKDLNGKLRELHLDQGYRAIKDLNHLKPIKKEEGLLFKSRYFNVEKLKINSPVLIKKPQAYFLEITVVDGEINFDNKILRMGGAFILTYKEELNITGHGIILMTWIEK